MGCYRPWTEKITIIQFLHAWSGCDSVSAIYGQGKRKIIKYFNSSVQFKNVCSIFRNDRADKNDLEKAGNQLMTILYGGNAQSSLNSLRYNKYMSQVATTTSHLRPEMLPPTEAAVKHHTFRVYVQVHQWRNLSISSIDPVGWGWKIENNLLVPIMTDLDPAPPDILNFIRCKCKASSQRQCFSNICSCKKNSLHCVAACAECHGCDCENVSHDSLSRNSENDIL